MSNKLSASCVYTILRPDRLAVYSFALVPWMRPRQKRIDETLLPTRDVKFALLSLAISKLTDAGYQSIGMDHFALPDDELSIAYSEGTLSRNFMGYTTKRGTEIVGLGSSAISDISSAEADAVCSEMVEFCWTTSLISNILNGLQTKSVLIKLIC